MRPRVLIAEDDPGVAAFFELLARDCGYDVAVVSTTAGLRERHRSFRPAVVLLDLRLRDGDGVQVMRFLGEERSTASIVLVSGVDRKLLDTAMALGATHGLRMAGVLQKPVPEPELRALLEELASAGLTSDDLAEGLTRDEVGPWFMPWARLTAPDDWSVSGLEALVRWEHPHRGTLGPDAFLHLADEPVLMGRLTSRVVESTALALRRLADHDIVLRASVNLAPALLQDLSWPDRIARTWVEDAGLSADLLTIEITEQGVMDDPQAAMDVLTRFRLKGFGLALDDFGTGYSSLLQLYRLPFSTLKIDRSFVMDLEHSEEARTIVRCLLDLGRGLGLQTVAEGVCSPGIAADLWELGCRLVQGYLVCEPLPLEDVEEVVRNELS